MPEIERWGIAANVKEVDGALRVGAKVFVCSQPGDGERVQVHGRSIGGRPIVKWIPIKRLENFRPGMLSPNDQDALYWPTKDEATAVLRRIYFGKIT
jgi:hypothetical protein